MNNEDFLYEEIYSLYGTIKRARGPFLYTAKGLRLTDLYQEDGKAILGWGSSDAFTMLKNVLNRGLTGSFNTDYTGRIGKAVSSLLDSKRKSYIFTDKKKAEESCLSLGFNAEYYIPWQDEGILWADKDCIILRPALAVTEDIYIVCIKEESVGNTPDIGNERISGAMAEAVTRSIYDLIRALQTREEKDWFIYDSILSRYWIRKGPYLYPKVARESYRDFVIYCLKKGIVINPSYDSPSIVPFGADKGVFRILTKEPFNL